MSWRKYKYTPKKTNPKEAVILLVDVGKGVCVQDHDGQSFLHKSKQCASKIIQRKIFSTTSDVFNLILIGSDITNNEINSPNIEVKQQWFTAPNWNLLKEVKNLTATEVDSADWLEGLIVAVNVLKDESEAKEFSAMKIVMISNFATGITDEDHIDYAVNTMKDFNISLVVIGPQAEEENENGIDDEAMESKVQTKQEILIGRIVDEVDGVMCGFSEAMAQLDHYQKFTGKAQPWYCDLQIAGKIFIPITGYKKFAPKNLLQWKKRSVSKDNVHEEEVFFEGDTQVEKSDVIHSFLFGKTMVPISDEDKTSMKLTTERCLQVIGFTKKKNVPRHMLLGDSVHYIAAKSGNSSANKAVTALAKALLELDMVGIVRKVYCKNNAPRVGALMPTYEKDAYFFYYAQLPFAEDERTLCLPPLDKIQSRQEEIDAVNELIDAMDLTQYEEDEDPYSGLINPNVEHMNDMIVFKALNPDSKIPSEPSEAVRKLIRPNPEMLQNASAALKKIKRLYGLHEVEQINYRKGALDVFERNSSNHDDPADVDVKPENLVDSVANFVQSTVTEIGTVDPEGNFKKLLEMGEPFNKLFEQMQVAIRKLCYVPSTNAIGTQKPISALSFLRQHCVKQSPTSYNQFIASLKDDLTERNQSELWNLIVQDKLGLITSEETQESNVNAEEAEIFYQIKKCESQSELNYEMEVEDMLDMI